MYGSNYAAIDRTALSGAALEGKGRFGSVWSGTGVVSNMTLECLGISRRMRRNWN